ncbi:hypothetical protein IKQ26_09410 [bacterium]|nr:hypothetical protein [bacterium]
MLKTENKKFMVNIAITLCYAIFTFLIVLRHEIWEDEAQVWLLAQNLSIVELFQNLFSEGHPPLFYLLTMPFAKLGLGVFSMQVLCWLSCVFGVFLLFHYSPFKWWVNTSVVLSCGFLYAFPVIARSYSILPFLVFLSAILYEKRREMPILYGIILFLISMTHVIMLPFVSALLLCFILEIFKEKRVDLKTVSTAFLMFLGIVYVLLISLSAVEHNHFIHFYSNNNIYTPIIFLLKFFSTALGPLSKISVNFVFAYIILFLILLTEIFRFSKKAFFIALLSVIGQFTIYVMFYFSPVYQTRIFSMFIIILFCYWAAWKTSNDNFLKRNISVLLSIFFLLTTLNGIKHIKADYFQAYSGSKETAEFIRNNIDKDTVIFTDVAQTSASVLSYLNKGYKVLYAPSNRELKYAVWEKDTQEGFLPSEWSEYLAAKEGKFYLLLVEDKDIENTEKAFVSSNSISKKEKFYILKGRENE